jgi:hypothetical protein
MRRCVIREFKRRSILYTQGDGDETRAAQGAFLKELGLATETIQ